MIMKKKLLLVMILALVFCGCGKKMKTKEEEFEPVVPVKVTDVKRDNIYKTITLAGDVYGQQETKVYSKVSGKLLKKVKSEGDPVKEDETIALVERDEQAMEFADAEIKSPIDGIVTRYFVGLGGYVFSSQPMPQKPIAMVSNIDRVRIEMYASEKELRRIRKGQSAKIKADTYGNRSFRGKVTGIDTSADPATRKTKIKIEVPNEKRLLKSGMFVRADIIVGTHKNVIVVPGSAIIKKHDKKVVFVVEENRAKEIEVVTGMSDEEKTEIKSGLKVKQSVIYEGNFGLIDGTKVEIEK